MKFKIIFKKPVYSDIVLIYPNGEKLLKKYVFGNFSYQTLDITSLICFNLSIMWKTYKLFSYKRLNFSLKLNYFIVDLIKQIYEMHLQAYIEEVNPKFVITFIDDAPVFHRLNANYKKDSIFISIQNGLRPQSHFKYYTKQSDFLPHKMSHFFCFGSSDVKSFKKEGYKVDNYYPFGSLVGGIYWKEISKKTSIKYDICYVSCWVSESRSDLNENEMKVWRADRYGNKVLENNLKKLISENDYSVIIALKYENSTEEFEHFYRLFGDTVQYQYSKREEFSTYRAIDKSRLVISLYSTCGAETLGIGRKALFSNGSGNASIGIPSAGICYYEGEDYYEFKKKVENILNMSDDNFKEDISNIRKEIMNYKLNEMPHELISRFLQENK
tara:strand:+ start:9193 stop:10347 length:1155 start_codon:yes stop_codon:yes gene_type:complete